MKKSGVLNNICKFLELVSDDIIPLYNISFLLFLHKVNLFATENASGMRYRKQTMLFWIFRLLNFHGKCIRFCRDQKSSGTVLENKESKEYFNPQLYKPRIDFAVPSDEIKKNCVEKMKPGVIHPLWTPDETKLTIRITCTLC